ncbi:MAG: 1-acyl-sn-glycerol-3-phosphate acyltransferase [Candidatus Shapirobacteria bacterium]|nr:1-acyl-sn-glycerol-3-phosphate acyltransferase [Candidatus Shapirobacteria bacterium]
MIKGLIKINNDALENGAVVAMRNLIKRCNTKVEVKSSKEINKVLSKCPGVIVANHPAEADVLAILSAVKNRKDIFLIINSNLKNLIPNLDKQLIPVYIYHKITRTFEGRLKSRVLSFLNKNRSYSIEEEHQKNIESIDLAIDKVNRGGLVIIFPDGGDGKNGWFPGIGHLIHGVKNKDKSFITRAYIEGTSNWDYLRLLPLIGKFLPKFRVSFSKPIKMNEVEIENPRSTTTILENKYWQWISSLHLWTKLSKNYLWLRMLFMFWITKH